jgi:hypothetical protein
VERLDVAHARGKRVFHAPMITSKMRFEGARPYNPPEV